MRLTYDEESAREGRDTGGCGARACICITPITTSSISVLSKGAGPATTLSVNRAWCSYRGTFKELDWCAHASAHLVRDFVCLAVFNSIILWNAQQQQISSTYMFHWGRFVFNNRCHRFFFSFKKYWGLQYVVVCNSHVALVNCWGHGGLWNVCASDIIKMVKRMSAT